MRACSSSGAAVRVAAVGLALIAAACADPADEDRATAEAPSALQGAAADSLYVSDSGDDTVKRFAATTGAFLGVFVQPGSGGLHGPQGLVFGRHNPDQRGDLLVVNQNVELPINGEVLDFSGFTGQLNRKLVAASDPHAPFAPRGIVERNDRIFVADFNGFPGTPQGAVDVYNATTGAFIEALFAQLEGGFYPRGVVFGPDGKLYVSSLDNRGRPALPGGAIGRFDAAGHFELLFQGRLCAEGTVGAVERSTCERGSTCDCFLHRPESIVFGPDGRLYAASYRKDLTAATDVDRILVFDVSARRRVDMIVLDSPTDRAFAQALLFGPAGRLFVTVGDSEAHAGEVRRYDVQTKTFDIFVPPASRGGPLQVPTYLTFCNTDPATLAYDDLNSARRCSTR